MLDRRQSVREKALDGGVADICRARRDNELRGA